jgi:Ca2+-binding RTX toxin-like protein
MLGGAGDDQFVYDGLSATDAVISGGADRDQMLYDGWQGGEIDLPNDVEQLEVTAATEGFLVHGNDIGDTIDLYASPDLASEITVIGGAGSDYIRVTGAGASILGGGGNDALIGSALNDTLRGGDGDDDLDGGLGSDLLDGGAGNDSADYSHRTDPVQVSLDGVANDGAPGENDRLTHIENVYGGGGADRISGNSAVNILRGNGGNDTIYGGGGVDALDGGPGHNLVVP